MRGDTVLLTWNFVGWSDFQYGNGHSICHVVACNPKETLPLEQIHLLLQEAPHHLGNDLTYDYQLNYAQYAVIHGDMDLNLLTMVAQWNSSALDAQLQLGFVLHYLAW